MRWEVFLCCGLSALFINSAMGANGYSYDGPGCNVTASNPGGDGGVGGPGGCPSNVQQPADVCISGGSVNWSLNATGGGSITASSTIYYCTECAEGYELSKEPITETCSHGSTWCKLSYKRCEKIVIECVPRCTNSGWSSYDNTREYQITYRCNTDVGKCEESGRNYRCKKGFYAESGSGSGLTCASCPTGSTTTGAGSTSSAACICIANWYKDGDGVCQRCPDYSTSSENSSGVDSCKCNENYFMDDDNLCTKCPQGATTAGIGAVGIDACICPVDTYRSENNCVKCSTGATTNGNSGQTSIDACVCEQNYYGAANKCSACPSGGVTADVNTTAITSCYISDGTEGKDMTGTFRYTAPGTTCSYQGT